MGRDKIKYPTIKTSTRIYGGIEAGGTKFVCAVGTGPEDLVIKRFKTSTPEETLKKVVQFFKPYTIEKSERRLAAVGIASFGPLDLNKQSPSYGCITNTPKPGWKSINLARIIKNALGVPVNIDTDVNGAASGEQKWGAARGLQAFIYLTIGTGIGGGGMINGGLMHGLVHPEMGHILIARDAKELKDFKGSCDYHKFNLHPNYSCWEGLASGTSMEQRWHESPEKMIPDHPNYNRAWELEANYLANGVVNLICTLSPQRIILGGGIMEHTGLLEEVRKKVLKQLNNYVSPLVTLEQITNYLVRPELKDKTSGAYLSGVLGAIILAKHLKPALP